MKYTLFTFAFFLLASLAASSQTPLLGTYPSTAISSAGGNMAVTPSFPPVNTVSAFVTASPGFKGLLHTDPVTGRVVITNAAPAGTYTIQVKANNGTESASSSFALTVGNPSCSQGLFVYNSIALTESSLYGVAIGDFNSDGKQDVAGVNYGAANIAIRLGNGSGGFTTATSVPVGTQPYALVTADFNGDGKADLATANSGNSTISIRMGNGNGGFGGTTTIAVGLQPRSLVTADFNGDGRLDLATANYQGNTVSVRLGNGAGDFAGPTELVTGSNPSSIAAGDFDGDGQQDLVVTNYTSNDMSLFIGNGAGGFTTAVTFPLGVNPASIVVSDFNGDAKPDIAVANSGNGTVSVRLGDGAGSFSAIATVPVGAGARSIATCDANGDGKTDLLVANYNDGTISLRTGNGAGGFTGNVNLVAAGSMMVAAGDFNADGKQDFVYANPVNSAFYTWLGGAAEINVKAGAVTITDNDTSPSPADSTDFGSTSSSLVRTFTVENSGNTLLTISGIGITGLDAASFSVSGLVFPVKVNPGSSVNFKVDFRPVTSGIKTAVVNINNDDCDETTYDFAIQATAAGIQPVIGSYVGASIAYAGGNITVSPSAVPANTAVLKVAASKGFRGTLAVSSATGVVSIVNAYPAGNYTITVKAYNGFSTATASFSLNVGNNLCSQGRFVSSAIMEGGYQTMRGSAIADFDGDGNQDIVAANSSNTSVTIRFGDGLGGSSRLKTLSVGTEPFNVAVGDFNGDGKQDIAVVNRGSDYLSIRLGNGVGDFSAAPDVAVQTESSVLLARDFNSDGRLDLAIGTSAGVVIRLGDGLGKFSPGSSITQSSQVRNIVSGDFNNDGTDDLVTTNAGATNASVYLGNGAGGFSAGAGIPSSYMPGLIVMGDFNSDGHQDLAFGNTSNFVSLRYGNGSGGFPGTGEIPVGTYGVRDLVTADFTGDGILDLAMLTTVNTLVTWPGDGAGSFRVNNFGSPTLTTQFNIIACNFNGDTRMDIIASQTDGNLRVYLANDAEINVRGNNTVISPGDNTPSLADFTDFGSGGGMTREYIIQNTGLVDLMVSDIRITGSDSSQFQLTGLTVPAIIAPGASGIFTVVFSPATTGMKLGRIVIINDDCDEAVYDFAIAGMATSTAPQPGTYPSTVIPIAGSSYVIKPSSPPTGVSQLIALAPASFKGTIVVNPSTGVISVTNAHPAGNYTITIKGYNNYSNASSDFQLQVGNTSCGQASFSGSNFAGGITGSRSVCLGDFNGDGFQDFAAASQGAASVAICLGTRPGVFSQPSQLAVGLMPSDIGIGDFNGDGRQDLAVSNYGSSTVSIRIGDGAGGFTGTVSVPVGLNPSSIVIGDFNGDGLPDLATCNTGAASISVRLGNGLGNFSGTTEVPVGNSPLSLVQADFNNDGKTDLATVNNTSNSLSVRFGNGSGGFTAGIEMAVGVDPRALVAADFNRDGNADLAVTNDGVNTVSIRLGNGNGGFIVAADVPVGTNPWGIATGDFNSDGKPDLAITSNSSSSIHFRMGDGGGGFSGTTTAIVFAPQQGIAVGDFNKDGRQDILVNCASNNAVYIKFGFGNDISVEGNGNEIVNGKTTADFADSTDLGNAPAIVSRSFTIRNYGPGILNINSIKVRGADSTSFSISDLTFPYAIAGFGSARFTVNFTPTVTGIKKTTLSIVNDDCKEGLYTFGLQATGVSPVLGTYANINFATSGANAMLNPSSAPAHLSGATAICKTPGFKGLLQVNLLTGVVTITNAYPAGSYQVVVKAFNSFTSVTTAFTINVGSTPTPCNYLGFANSKNIGLADPYNSTPYAIAIADFNTDGKQDFVVSDSYNKNVTAFLGDGTGNFTSGPVVPTGGTDPQSVTIADFNADGKQDLAIANSGSNTVSIRLGDGTGGFTGSYQFAAGATPYCVVAGDLNNDGKQDLAIANLESLYIDIRLGNGDGTFSTAPSVSLGFKTRSLVISDFNGDGILDLAIPGTYNSPSVFIKLGDGSGNFPTTSLVPVAGSPAYLTTGDFNGDNYQDLAVSNYDQSISIRLGDGMGNFTGTYSIATPVSVGGLQSADLNRDGKLDLVVARGSVVSVSYGTGSGTFSAATDVSIPGTSYGLALGDFNADGRFDLAAAVYNTHLVSIRLGGDNEITLKGNGVEIMNADSTLSFTDNTFFGASATNTLITRSFSIQNSGVSDLNVSAINITGADSSLFTRSGLTLPVVVGPGKSVAFNVGFLPLSVGQKNALITITSNDCDETQYRFAIGGNSVTPVLGTYSAASIPVAGGGLLIPPTNPANVTAGMSVSAGANFRGTIAIDQATGAITVTNAQPAGVYVVKVRTSSLANTFTLTVGNTNCSQGLFSVSNIYNSSSRRYSTAGDFNNDSKQDLVLITDSTVLFFAGTGTGAFNSPVSTAVSPGCNYLTSSDYNEDGKLDIAIISYQYGYLLKIYLGTGNGSFESFSDISNMSEPVGIAASDFNNDGHTDLAIADFYSSVLIRHGNGAGSFTAINSLQGIINPRFITTADLNNDGNVDIITGNNNGNVSVRLGNGSGGFTVYSDAISNVPTTYGVAVADFNLDGKQDLAVLGSDFGKAFIRFGDGLGGFSGSKAVVVGTNPKTIVAGDFNGDGKPDIAVGNAGGSTAISIRLGDGTGNFITVPDIPSASYPIALAVADFNQDGIQDISFLNASGLFVAAGFNNPGEIYVQGNGHDILNGSVNPDTLNFTAFGNVGSNLTRRFTVTNTGPGKLIIYNISLTGTDSASFRIDGLSFPATVLPGTTLNVDVRFEPGSVGLKSASVNIASDDCDERNYVFAIQGNGIVSLPVLTNYSDIIIARAGTAGFADPSQAPANTERIQVVAPSSFKGTLRADRVTGRVRITNPHPAGIYTINVVAFNGFSQVRKSFALTVNKPDCSQALFATATDVPAGSGLQSICLGDFNSDGNQDMATTNSGGNTVSVRYGNGTGGFTGSTTVPTGTGPKAVVTADFNGDGMMDLVTANSGAGGISFRPGDGSGNFSGSTNLFPSLSLSSIAVGDFNSDGKPDMACAGSGTQNILLLFGDGSGAFVQGPSIILNATFRSVVAGDFNTDGNLDIAAVNTSPGSVAIRFGNGLGDFTGTTNIGTGSQSVVVGDFNNDDNQDLAVSNGSRNSVSILLGSVAGVFTAAPDVTFSSNVGMVAVGDFNGDGQQDLAIVATGTGQMAILKGNGLGGFDPPTTLAFASAAVEFTVGDFNNDGKQDLAVTGASNSNVFIRLGVDKEINVKGNGVDIVKGSTTTSAADFTDFGNVVPGVVKQRSFSIENTGVGNMAVTGIQFAGADSLLFSVSGITLPTTVTSGATLSFTVSYAPVSFGVKKTRVHILNNDCDESDYDFSLLGGIPQPGAALAFDGLNDHVSINSTIGNLDTAGFTIAAWIRTSVGTASSILSKRGSCLDDNYINFGINATGRLSLTVAGNASNLQILSGSRTVNDDNWHQVTAVRNQTGLALYVDGLYDSSSVSNGVAQINNNAPLLLGAPACSTTESYFMGAMDEIRLYNRVLTLGEIQTMVSCELGTNRGGLKLYFKCNQGLAADSNALVTQAIDSSGNNNNGVLTNFSLSGSTSNWIAPGGVTTGTACSGRSMWMGMNHNWNDPANWSMGFVPSAFTRVMINNMAIMPEISDPNSVCYSLSLSNGATLTIKSTGNLTILH